jgi:hypothetical protein
MKASQTNIPINIIYIFIFSFFFALLLQSSSALSEATIKTSDISEISLDEIGILNSKNGGLSSDIWINSRYKFIESLLTKISNDASSHMSSATIKDLRYKTLLTGATPPTLENPGGESLLIIRLNTLASLGYHSDIEKIIKLVPTIKIDERINTIKVASYFIGEEYKEACKEVENFITIYKSVFWRESDIICNAYNRNDNKLNFNLLLLSEDGYKISANLQTAIESFKKGDKFQGSIEWSNILKNTSLKNQLVVSKFPEAVDLKKTVINKNLINEWHDKNKNLKDALLVEKLAQLYAKIDAAGDTVPLFYWQDLILYAMSNNIKLPELAVYKSIKGGNKGEVILLSILCMGNNQKGKISDFLLIQIIESLNKTGLKEEAKKLAEEMIPE